jgi:site-specific DNA-methyltransferase (adenine-specific)
VRCEELMATKWREERIGNQRLILGDCLEVLPTLEAGSVDAVVTDPPYGTKTDQRDEWMIGEFSNVMPLALPLIHACLAKDGAFYCFTSWTMMADWLLRYQQYFKLQNIIVWDKRQHSGCYSPHAWQYTWEGIFFGIKGRRPVREYMRDVLTSEETGKRQAMQKPVDILQQLMVASTDEGQVVADPFLGTGSTCVAAELLGRRGIGIEIDPQYFEIACRRVEQAAAQPRLFAPDAPPPAEQYTLAAQAAEDGGGDQ